MKDIEINDLINQLKIYLNIFKNYDDFNEKDKWFSILNGILDEILNFKQENIDWKYRYDIICKILYFFAGRMGSFQEIAPQNLLEKSNLLLTLSKQYLRVCWEKQGNESSNIKDSELYKIGDEVHLIKYQLMNLTFGGYNEIADFAMNHKYTIIDILERDVSNMPQYLIEFDNFKRTARHNSLKKIT